MDISEMAVAGGGRCVLKKNPVQVAAGLFTPVHGFLTGLLLQRNILLRVQVNPPSRDGG